MGNLNVTYLPPQNWQDFEKFIKGVVDVIWEQNGWHNYGRSGQGQSGMDLFGYDEQGRFTAIQCKKKSQTDVEGELLTKSLLTEKLINDEIAAAEAIRNPEIERLIFATTSPRDTAILDIVKRINDERITAGKFRVDIWFWDDFQVLIENHIELMYFYYTDVLEKVHKYDKDTHILIMLRQAFTRPAFSREMYREESGANFIQAIRDTMEAITSGKLYNRRGELITTSRSYEKITNQKWKKEIREIYNRLDEVRNIYQEGLLRKSIIEHPTMIEILDHHLSEKFNRLRRECLKKLNAILVEAKLKEVDSGLLK